MNKKKLHSEKRVKRLTSSSRLTIKLKDMKPMTIETAIKQIENKFQECASILDVDIEKGISIICKNIATGKYYEAWAEYESAKLHFCEIKF